MPVDTALGIDTKINSLHPAYWLKSFNSNHTISSNNHHAYISFLISIHFHSVVHHQVHELVKPTKSSNHHPVCIQLDLKLLIHVFLEIRRLA